MRLIKKNPYVKWKSCGAPTCRGKERKIIYVPFYRIGPKFIVGDVLKNILQKMCMHANCIIFNVPISSNCAVNSHIVFSESFEYLSSHQIVTIETQ